MNAIRGAGTAIMIVVLVKRIETWGLLVLLNYTNKSKMQLVNLDKGAKQFTTSLKLCHGALWIIILQQYGYFPLICYCYYRSKQSFQCTIINVI